VYAANSSSSHRELLKVEPDGSLTGRDLGALHEGVMETDPSEREGADS
jgi:hypothetical protein